MKELIADHIGWVIGAVNGAWLIVLYFIKRWMKDREDKEKEIQKKIDQDLQKKIDKVNEEMKTMKGNYLGRFELITENQNKMQVALMAEFNDFKLQVSGDIKDLSNKLDNKHEPLQEQLRELLKKFEP